MTHSINTTTSGVVVPVQKIQLTGIFGSPQPSQVKRGSIPQPVRSRQNANDKPSRFITVTPAFAYRTARSRLSSYEF